MPICKEKEFEIHFYETDFRRRVLPSRLLNYCDDIAVTQTEDLGVGIDYLSENHIAWVLHQWDIKIADYPVFQDTIRVKTTPYASKKFYAYRLYEIFNTEGRKIFTAHSSWFLIDLDKKRPLKIPDHMRQAYGMADEPEGALELEKPSEINDYSDKKTFQVRYSDIDTNRHVNNVKYVEWAMEALPFEILEQCTLRELKIIYKKEAKYADQVESWVKTEGGQNRWRCYHKIAAADGSEFCTMESIWDIDASTDGRVS